MSIKRVVIDTNVLYSGLYSASGASFQILCLVEERQLTPVLSTALLFEYEEVLTRNHDALGLTPLDIEDVLDGLCRRGDNRKIHFLWRPQLRDVKDDHVLELAVSGGCVDIITHNVKDFGAASYFGVRVLSPGKLLRELQ